MKEERSLIKSLIHYLIKMKIVGITGGIGSGKSVVCEILKTLNYAIYDSDSQAKLLMQTSPIIKSKLTELIGENVYISGQINKPIISAYLFSSEENLNNLNSIVHPEVCSHFEEWSKVQTSDIVFVESAILFESGLNTKVDEVWCVACDTEERIRRVMQRNGLGREEVLARINSQMEDKRRSELSTFVIDNSGNKSLLKQIIKILRRV